MHSISSAQFSFQMENDNESVDQVRKETKREFFQPFRFILNESSSYLMSFIQHKNSSEQQITRNKINASKYVRAFHILLWAVSRTHEVRCAAYVRHCSIEKAKQNRKNDNPFKNALAYDQTCEHWNRQQIPANNRLRGIWPRNGLRF